MFIVRAWKGGHAAINTLERHGSLVYHCKPFVVDLPFKPGSGPFYAASLLSVFRGPHVPTCPHTSLTPVGSSPSFRHCLPG